MKSNYLLTIFILLITFNLNAQTKRITISEQQIGSISSKYIKSINTETKDSLYLVYLGFQNEKYKTITDIKSISLSNKGEKDELVEDLKTASIEVENKVEMNWNRNNYQILLFDFTNQVYIYGNPKKGSGYTTLNKKETEKLIEWLESIDFGKG